MPVDFIPRESRPADVVRRRYIQPTAAMQQYSERVSEPHAFLPMAVQGMNLAFPGVGSLMNPMANRLLHEFDMQDEGAQALGNRVTDALSPYVPAPLAGGAGALAYTVANLFDGTPGFNPAMITYHGSPHKWLPEPGFPKGRPRLDKIGTGEGAQVYGHGIYSAESPKVGEFYKQSLSDGHDWNVLFDGEPLELVSGVPDIVKDQLKISGFPKYAIEDMWTAIERSGYSEKDVDDAIVWLKENKERFTYEKPGAVYKLDLQDDDVGKYLDWDAPLKSQSDQVRKVIEDARFPTRNLDAISTEELRAILQYNDPDGAYTAELALLDGFDPPTREEMIERFHEMNLDDLINGSRIIDHFDPDMPGFGRSLYKSLSTVLGGMLEGDKYSNPSFFSRYSGEGQVRASEYLRSLGIPGMRYLDGVSRNKSNGTRNYVTWDQDVLDRSKVLPAE